MESNIGCHVIRDILPLYIDGLTSEESNVFIQEHIDKCTECKKLEEIMRKGENSSLREESVKEIDGFRKIKMLNKKKIGKVVAISICVTILVACIIAVNTYIKGEQLDSSNLEINVLSVEDKYISLDIKLKDNVSGITEVDVKENNGEIKVMVKGAPKSLFSKKNVAIEKKFKSKVKKIMVADALVAEEGYIIDEDTRNIYNNRIKKVKDGEKLSNLVNFINVKVPYFETNLLEVDELSPHKVILEASRYGNMEAENVEHYALLYSYYMFACVEELETIEWRYNINNKKNTYEVQLGEVAVIPEVEDIKSFGKNAVGIIKLEDALEKVY